MYFTDKFVTLNVNAYLV